LNFLFWSLSLSFPGFQLHYFQDFYIYIEFLFHSLIVFLISLNCLFELLEFIQLLFVSSLNSFRCLYMSSLILSIILVIVLLSSLFKISFASLLFKFFIVELLTFGKHCLVFSYCLCFYVGIYASETKSLVESLNHL
jgi:hypothetical protein